MYKVLCIAPALVLLLAGCETITERVAVNARLACFQAGYGETSPRHDECMRTVVPVGVAQERRKALDEGIALIGAGLHPNGVTCIRGGAVVTCHE